MGADPLDLDALERRWAAIHPNEVWSKDERVLVIQVVRALIARVRELEAEVVTARASYNALSEEVWKLHDEQPYLNDRIGLMFSNVARRVKP